MDIKTKLKSMGKDEWLLINAPCIDHAICGTRRVGITKRGVIRIEYVNGTIEENKATKRVLDTNINDISLTLFVSDVQSQR